MADLRCGAEGVDAWSRRRIGALLAHLVRLGLDLAM